MRRAVKLYVYLIATKEACEAAGITGAAADFSGRARAFLELVEDYSRSTGGSMTEAALATSTSPSTSARFSDPWKSRSRAPRSLMLFSCPGRGSSPLLAQDLQKMQLVPTLYVLRPKQVQVAKLQLASYELCATSYKFGVTSYKLQVKN